MARCSPAHFAAENDLWRAAALNDLAHWIGKAQHLIESVVRAVNGDEALQKTMQGRGIGVFDVEWHNHHADGLEVLHMEVDDHLRQVRQILGIESSGLSAMPHPRNR